jgi:hypothetical protein
VEGWLASCPSRFVPGNTSPGRNLTEVSESPAEVQTTLDINSFVLPAVYYTELFKFPFRKKHLHIVPSSGLLRNNKVVKTDVSGLAKVKLLLLLEFDS